MAKPLFCDAVKHDTTRVCHFSGETMVYSNGLQLSRPVQSDARLTLYGAVGLVKLKI